MTMHNIFINPLVQALIGTCLLFGVFVFSILIMIRGLRLERFKLSMFEIMVLVLVILDLLLVIGMDAHYPMHAFFEILSNGYLQMIFIACVYGLLLYWVLIERQLGHQSLSGNSIREAIDNLPVALGFADEQGLPILSNRKMQAISQQLTNHHFRNAFEFWEGSVANHETKVHSQDQVVIQSDDVHWQISKHKYKISDDYFIHVNGINVSKVYELHNELQLENERLNNQQQRLTTLLQDIEQIKKDEETLALKMRIHNELGKVILASKQYLHAQSPHDLNTIIHFWNQVIESMGVSGNYLDGSVFEMYQQIKDAAHMIGCEIEIVGQLPVETNHGYLVMIAIKEAIINAMKHARANRVHVEINAIETGYDIIIKDNGTFNGQPLVEGGGLASLRQKIEQANGSLRILGHKQVQLNIHLPYNEGEVVL